MIPGIPGEYRLRHTRHTGSKAGRMSHTPQDVAGLSIEVAELRRQVSRLMRLLGQDRADNDRSIPGFCRRQGFSRAHYYNLKKIGKAPREMASGTRRTISPQAEADWEAEREAEALRNGRDAKPSKRQREREAAALADGGGE